MLTDPFVQAEGPVVKDVLDCGILEPYLVKYWGIKLASNAAITVLRVDQVCTPTLNAHCSSTTVASEQE